MDGFSERYLPVKVAYMYQVRNVESRYPLLCIQDVDGLGRPFRRVERCCPHVGCGDILYGSWRHYHHQGGMGEMETFLE